MEIDRKYWPKIMLKLSLLEVLDAEAAAGVVGAQGPGCFVFFDKLKQQNTL